MILILASSAVAQWSEPSAEDIIVRGGWLFDGVSNTRRQNTGIVIREFAEVNADLQEQVLAAANVIDLTDADTILPGMIDLHAHYNFNLVDVGRTEEVIYNGEWRDLDLVSG
jgi:N-acyl-D-aspartate/D-glutamate deacylase